jgi:hypothetical protein
MPIIFKRKFKALIVWFLAGDLERPKTVNNMTLIADEI